MKKREMILLNSFLGLLIIGFGWLAFSLSINPSSANGIVKNMKANTAQAANNKPCSKNAPQNIPANTTDPSLIRLRNYQEVCQSSVTNKMMFFTAFSGTKEQAQKDAATMAAKLRAFHGSGISPIVIVEPYANDHIIGFKEYLKGDLDGAQEEYFKQLKAAGITDEMMGMWVPFPEPNVPNWNNHDAEPRDFAKSVNKYLSLLKQHFPKTHGSVLLNATTYDPGDLGWENGDYISLSQYVDAIDHNLVDSFGIQGFPWMTNAQQRKRTIFKATEFLQPDLAIGGAQVLRTRDIWINTGTFASKYTNDPTKTVHLSINERKALLTEILEVAKGIREYQQNEYRVFVNLFSEDKSATTEATDWSYFQDEQSKGVLREFITQMHDLEIPLSLYDEAKWTLR